MIKHAILSSLALSLLFACGGGGSNKPTALSHRYDEVYIAQFSLADKAAVLEAQNEFQRARAEEMKIESELREDKTALDVARNDLKRAQLAEKSASQAKSAADSSGDMNRINRASRDTRVAELSRRAADEKVAYLKVHHKYLNKLLRYRQEETYHREARYEYAKAKLGQAKNIAPRGVNYDNYKSQVDERSRRAQKALQDSESYKQKSIAAKKTWQGRLKEAEQAKGTSSGGSDSESSSDGSNDSE